MYSILYEEYNIRVDMDGGYVDVYTSIHIYVYVQKCIFFCLYSSHYLFCFQYGCTPLLCVCSDGHADTARLLLDSGANMEAVEEVSHRSYINTHSCIICVVCKLSAYIMICF